MPRHRQAAARAGAAKPGPCCPDTPNPPTLPSHPVPVSRAPLPGHEAPARSGSPTAHTPVLQSGSGLFLVAGCGGSAWAPQGPQGAELAREAPSGKVAGPDSLGGLLLTGSPEPVSSPVSPGPHCALGQRPYPRPSGPPFLICTTGVGGRERVSLTHLPAPTSVHCFTSLALQAPGTGDAPETDPSPLMPWGAPCVENEWQGACAPPAVTLWFLGQVHAGDATVQKNRIAGRWPRGRGIGERALRDEQEFSTLNPTGRGGAGPRGSGVGACRLCCHLPGLFLSGVHGEWVLGVKAS